VTAVTASEGEDDIEVPPAQRTRIGDDMEGPSVGVTIARCRATVQGWRDPRRQVEVVQDRSMGPSKYPCNPLER
jgi:hypothetical protein